MASRRNQIVIPPLPKVRGIMRKIPQLLFPRTRVHIGRPPSGSVRPTFDRR